MATNAKLHEASSMKHDEKPILPGEPKQLPAEIHGVHNGPRPGPQEIARLRELHYSWSQVHCMATKAVVELGIPDILAKADGGKPLSAPEILAKLPTKSSPGSTSASNLRRLMRPLVIRGVFSETLNDENQPAYGLTEISNLYRRDNEQGMAPVADFVYAMPVLAMLGNLHEVILDEDATPFVVGNGMPKYEYLKKHPETSARFNKFMGQKSKFEVKEVVDALEKSDWLEGVKIFVDVGGGGEGIIAGDIVARNPRIQGINFDQPHVVEGAPEVKGVRFVGGDFLKEIPSGDAMFLKIVIHNHTDEVCIRILKNCFEALPKGGKCILAETLVKDYDGSHKAKSMAIQDIFMLGLFKGGKERSLDEIQKIMQAAGFSQFRTIETPTMIDLILGIKE